MQAEEVLDKLPQLQEHLQPLRDSVAAVHAGTPIAHVLDDLYAAAQHLATAVREVQKTFDVDARALENSVQSWYSLLKKLGLYKDPAHGLQCLRYLPVKNYEHMLGEHMVDMLKKAGPPGKRTSLVIEVGHKHSKHAVRHNSSHGGGVGANDTDSFHFLPRQVLRRTCSINACGRELQLQRTTAALPAQGAAEDEGEHDECSDDDGGNDGAMSDGAGANSVDQSSHQADELDDESDLYSSSEEEMEQCE